MPWIRNSPQYWVGSCRLQEKLEMSGVITRNCFPVDIPDWIALNTLYTVNNFTRRTLTFDWPFRFLISTMKEHFISFFGLTNADTSSGSSSDSLPSTSPTTLAKNPVFTGASILLHMPSEGAQTPCSPMVDVVCFISHMSLVGTFSFQTSVGWAGTP